MDRRSQLKHFYKCLNTPEGKELVDELRLSWDDSNPLDENAQTMGFNVGLQQAYRQILAWQEGEGLSDTTEEIEDE